MVTLEDKATGRDNNLNLIRAVAATLVLVSHATQIIFGKGTDEPFVASLGYSLGTLSVFAFFAISGFLISASFERSSSYTSFITARVLRIMPGLFVSLAFVVLILGPAVTTLPLGAYFTDLQTLSFLPRNLTLISQEYGLPGVFETNPQPDVESSIWTLIHEVLCYVGVFVVGVMGLFKSRLLFGLAVLAYLAVWFGFDAMDWQLDNRIHAFHFLTVPFVIGMVFWVWRDKLILSLPIFAVLCALTWVLRATPVYYHLLALALSYGVFWLAYIPGGEMLRAYNKLGDYSYGIYIYAFPIQGLVYWLWGPQSILENIALSFPITLILSIASWHWVEKPCLAMKSQVVARFKPHSSS